MGPLPAAGAAPGQTQRTSPRRRTQPTVRRTLAALGALLAFMAVLAVVPLATAEPAEAHTKTVKRCSYDPFTNVQQCWNETVAHTHRTIPDNPPPDTTPKPEKCPTGTTGTPPNCLPIPPTNDPAPDPEDKECPAGTTGTPPNCKTQPPPECPAGQTGTWPNCKTPPKTCPAGQHSNGGAGKNCHSHSFTPPHCGTGTWSPGHGHTPVPLKPCPKPKTCADGYSGTPPNCVKDKPKTTQPPRCATGWHQHLLGAERNRGGGTPTGCHLASGSHCGDRMHEHVHGSQNCHRALNQCEPGGANNSLGCLTEHCPTGHHEHTHGSGDCHPSGTKHCEDGEHNHSLSGMAADEVFRTNGGGCHPASQVHCTVGQHQHGDSGCHGLSHSACKDGEHEHASAKRPNIAYYTCHPKTDVHYQVSTLDRLLLPPIFCGLPTRKITDALLRIAIRGGCKEMLDKGFENEENYYELLNKEHDAEVDQNDDTDDDSGSGSSDDNSGGGQPQADPNDPDGDYDGDGKTTAEEAHEASLRYEAGELTDAEYYRIIYKSWCDRGDSYYCGKKPPQ